MMTQPARVAVIGGGISGLTAARELVLRGFPVTIYESGPVPGGLARSFPLSGTFVDAYYHFFCRPDRELFELLTELKLDQDLHWKKTRMGLFVQDRLVPFGNPLDLLRFPFFSMRDRYKFGRGILLSKLKSRDDWRLIENIPAETWLVDTFGARAYELIHEPLIRLKFGDDRHRLSASWIWARIFRVGKSRTRFQRELLGYLEGGMHRLITALITDIRARGGRILLSRPVTAVERRADKLRVRSPRAKTESFQAVISTVNPQELLTMLGNPEGPYFDLLRRIRFIAVKCMLFQLNQSFSPYFWMNVNDPRIPLAGLIQTTNLDPQAGPGNSTLLYAPRYIGHDHPNFSQSEQDFREEIVSYLQLIRPDFNQDCIMKSVLFTNTFAQPICETGFTSSIPDMETPLPGLFLTDSSQLHPDDRTVANSIGLGKKVAALVGSWLRDAAG